MRSGKRDALLYILAVSAGAADGWSYFELGHSFVANMTGNTVLLGIAVLQKNRDLLHPFVSLICYGVGVAIPSFVTRRTPPGVWTRAISRALLIEACLITGAEAGWFALHRFPGLPNGTRVLPESVIGWRGAGDWASEWGSAEVEDSRDRDDLHHGNMDPSGKWACASWGKRWARRAA
jgi:hypothetical protein